MIDNFKNFAKATLASGIDASTTTINVTSGHGLLLPTPPFNATVYNFTDFPDPSDDPNKEIVRVTAIATDALTVTRAQEGTTGATHNTGGKTYKLVAGLTAKSIVTDVMGAISRVPEGRLTLETGVAISTSDQTAKTTIYYTPFGGNRIPIYDGTTWNFMTFTELSLPLGTLTSGKNYDVFVYNNAMTPTLELSAAWTSDTARADALALQDGIYVKGADHTRRYLGTFRTTTTTTTEDSLLKRLVWNYYHRTSRRAYVAEAANHAYNGDYRPWNNNTANSVQVLFGLAEASIPLTLFSQTNNPSAWNVVALGLDSTTTLASITSFVILENVGGAYTTTVALAPMIGFHTLYLLESTLSVVSGTFEVAALTVLYNG